MVSGELSNSASRRVHAAVSADKSSLPGGSIESPNSPSVRVPSVWASLISDIPSRFTDLSGQVEWIWPIRLSTQLRIGDHRIAISDELTNHADEHRHRHRRGPRTCRNPPERAISRPLTADASMSWPRRTSHRRRCPIGTQHEPSRDDVLAGMKQARKHVAAGPRPTICSEQSPGDIHRRRDYRPHAHVLTSIRRLVRTVDAPR